MNTDLKGKYIVVEGNIGAGKTSLTRMLTAELGGESIMEEFAENIYLPRFYEDPVRFAFPLELSFLSARYKQLEDLFKNQNDRVYVADYHFEKSYHFASINLIDSERAIYESIFSILQSHIRKPDLVIFLDKGIDQLSANIKKRGRHFESGITEEYLMKITNAYQFLLEKTGKENSLIIDTNQLDFVQNNEDYQFILNAVKSKLSAIKC